MKEQMVSLLLRALALGLVLTASAFAAANARQIEGSNGVGFSAGGRQNGGGELQTLGAAAGATGERGPLSTGEGLIAAGVRNSRQLRDHPGHVVSGECLDCEGAVNLTLSSCCCLALAATSPAVPVENDFPNACTHTSPTVSSSARDRDHGTLCDLRRCIETLESQIQAWMASTQSCAWL